MNISLKNLDKSRVEILGELPAADFDTYVAAATQSAVANAEIEGFRKGKAPEKLVIEKIGEDHLLQDAAERALQAEWPKILDEQKIEAIGPAEFHILKLARGNNLEWKAIVAKLPEVTLPDWRATAKEINAERPVSNIVIEEKEIDDTLAYIQKSRTKEGEEPKTLDDAFAQSIGNFPTLQALKDNIRDGLKQEKEAKSTQEYHTKLMTGVASKATVEIPEVMIEREQNKMAEELRASIEDMGLTWQQYLDHIKKTEDDLKKGWHEDAEKRVRVGLVLLEIAKQEKIEPTEQEIADQVKRITNRYPEEERSHIDPARMRDYAYNMIRNEKVLELLESQK